LKFKPFDFSTNLIGKIVENKEDSIYCFSDSNNNFKFYRGFIYVQSEKGVFLSFFSYGGSHIFISYQDLLSHWQFTEEYTDIFNHSHNECGVIDYDN